MQNVCKKGTEVRGEKLIWVSQHPVGESDVALQLQSGRAGLWVCVCVNCSLQGSRLHVGHYVFAMQMHEIVLCVDEFKRGSR